MKKNIKIFYVLAFLQGLVFYSSIATLYRTSRGISLLEMGIIESCFSIFMIVMEIPWGYICDRIGYKKTMLIANGFYFLSKVVFWKAYSFPAFLMERFLLALSVSGLSGCDSSLLYLSTTPEEATGVKRISKEKIAVSLFIGATVSVIGLILSKDAISSVLLLAILACIECMYFPILTTIENESVEVSARATMISVYSLVMNIFSAGTSLCFGKVAVISLYHAYGLAIVFCILGVILFLIWDRIRRKSKVVIKG